VFPDNFLLFIVTKQPDFGKRRGTEPFHDDLSRLPSDDKKDSGSTALFPPNFPFATISIVTFYEDSSFSNELTVVF